MALTIQINNTEIGVGDTVRVLQKIVEEGKPRSQTFEGIVIAIKGERENKTFTVRKIGLAKIGIERIFPYNSPSIEEVKVIKSGVKGSNRAKLYYIRAKSRKEIDAIYSRAKRRK